MLEIKGYGQPERPIDGKNRLLGDGAGYDLHLKDASAAFPWHGLAITVNDLQVNNKPEIYGIEQILHETDPNRSRSYRALTALLKQLRERRRNIAKQLSRQAFNQVVRRRTSAFARVIRKWDGGYLWKHSIHGSTWVWYEQRPGELLSKKKFLEAVLAEPKTPARVRLKAIQTLRGISEHPEWDIEEYAQWVDVIAHVLADNTWRWFLRFVPRMQLVRVPARDWAKIRQDWLQIRIRVQKELEIVDQQIYKLIERRAKYQLHNVLQYHRMCHTGTAHSMHLTGSYRICEPHGSSSTTHQIFDGSQYWFGANASNSIVWSASPSDGWEEFRVGFDHGQTPSPTWTAKEIHTFAKEHSTRQIDTALEWDPIYNSSHPYLIRSNSNCWKSSREDEFHYSGGLYSQDQNYLYREQTMELSTKSERVPTKPTIIDLDSYDGLDIEDRFEERRLLDIKRLLALDVNSKGDALVFNAARSVGELKDTPQTLRSGRDFLIWCKASRGREYYEIHTKNGVRFSTLKTDSGLLGRVARITADSQGNRAVIKSKRLKALGITKVVRRRVGLLTNAATLASVYLAWKFGISQTLADTNTVLHSGWRFACSVRRGLGQLLSHLNAAKDLHPIRRMWRCRSPHLPRSMKIGSYYETDLPSSKECSISDRVDLNPFFETNILGRPFVGQLVPGHSEWRIVTSEKGLWFADPSWAGKTLDQRREYYAAIQAHNQQVIDGWQAQMGANAVIYTRNDMRGVVFAKFSWRSLLKAVRGGWNNLNARLKSFTTAWELAPLSFVVEWISNIRTLVDSAQALIEKTEVKVSPVGKPWEMLSTRLWVGHLEVDTVGTVDCSIDQIGRISFYCEHSDTSGYHNSLASIVSVPTKLSYTFKFRRDAPSGVIMSRTQIRRAIRRPYEGKVDELPSAKVRLNLNVGKLGSLLAMVMQKLK